MTEKESRETPRWSIWLALLSIVVIVAILWFVLSPKENNISDNGHINNKTISLQCKSSKPDDPIFSSSTAKDVSHEIRQTFEDNKMHHVSYIFYGSYDSNQIAESANASLHGQYNKFMSEHSLSQRSLNPDFATIDDNLKITLFTERKNLNGITAAFFFLTSDEYQRLGSYTIDDMRNIYESKEFSCTIHE